MAKQSIDDLIKKRDQLNARIKDMQAREQAKNRKARTTMMVFGGRWRKLRRRLDLDRLPNARFHRVRVRRESDGGTDAGWALRGRCDRRPEELRGLEARHWQGQGRNP